MKLKHILFLMASCILVLTGCGTLKPATCSNTSGLSGYKYFYVTPTSSRVGASGGVYGYGYGVIGVSTTMSANPSDQISGYLITKGFIRVPEITDDIKGATVIVNYGEIGRRSCGLGSALEIVLQFIDAKSNEIVCTGTGEGLGETEADDIRMAITLCLDKIFEEMQVNSIQRENNEAESQVVVAN